MGYKLVIEIDEDMDREDAQMIAEELQEHEGVQSVEGMGWQPWSD